MCCFWQREVPAFEGDPRSVRSQRGYVVATSDSSQYRYSRAFTGIGHSESVKKVKVTVLKDWPCDGEKKVSRRA